MASFSKSLHLTTLEVNWVSQCIARSRIQQIQFSKLKAVNCSPKRTQNKSRNKKKETAQRFQRQILTHSLPVAHLAPPDAEPDAGQPMSDQEEHDHEHEEDHGAVLRPAVNVVEQTKQANETYGLQKSDRLSSLQSTELQKSLTQAW